MIPEPAGSCLDYCRLSQTPVPEGVPATARAVNRLRVYLSGEVEVSVLSVGGASKPPEPQYGPRWSRGISSSMARTVRRSVIAYDRANRCQWKMLTLTSQEIRSDEEMRASFEALLAWCRKYIPEVVDFYVWVAENQQRGVLHFHVLIPKRIPPGLFRRLRELWAVRYGMGPGSFDVTSLRRGKSAASYIGKMAGYLRKRPNAYRVGIDGDGSLSWEPWAVGRNGLPYERMEFRGRAADMSRLARYYAGVRVEVWSDWGAFPSVGLKGRSWFLGSGEEAEEFLAVLLGGTGPPAAVPS